MHKVKVCVRCRPIIRRETGKNHVELTDKNVLIRMNDTKEFGFDEVYDQKSTQQLVFETSIKPLIDGCFNGYNATVFACKLYILQFCFVCFLCISPVLMLIKCRWAEWDGKDVYYGYFHRLSGCESHQ